MVTWTYVDIPGLGVQDALECLSSLMGSASKSSTKAEAKESKADAKAHLFWLCTMCHSRVSSPGG